VHLRVNLSVSEEGKEEKRGKDNKHDAGHFQNLCLRVASRSYSLLIPAVHPFFFSLPCFRIASWATHLTPHFLFLVCFSVFTFVFLSLWVSLRTTTTTTAHTHTHTIIFLVSITVCRDIASFSFATVTHITRTHSRTYTFIYTHPRALTLASEANQKKRNRTSYIIIIKRENRERLRRPN
jgi:hypothetical protein